MYVGQTRNDVRKRWDSHKTPSGPSTLVKNSIKKHGWGNFSKEILVEVPNEKLNDYERLFIEKLGAFGKNGLNLTPGGQDCSPMLVPEIKKKRIEKMKVPEVRKRWLAAITTAQQNPDQKAKLSKLCKERCKDPLHMEKRKQGQKRYLETLTEEQQKNVISRMTTPEATEKRINSLKKTLATKEGKTNKSNATKASWKDPVSREKRIKALKEAALKRKKQKPDKVPYNKERRGEAMRLVWLKRKVIVRIESSAL